MALGTSYIYKIYIAINNYVTSKPDVYTKEHILKKCEPDANKIKPKEYNIEELSPELIAPFITNPPKSSGGIGNYNS